MKVKSEILQNAFPDSLKDEVKNFLNKIGVDELENYNNFLVILNGKMLEIPDRIYFDKPAELYLNSTENLIFNCLFTRHHNGFVREESLRKIISSNECWVAPFVVQLWGEYILEILNVIDENLNYKMLENIVEFVIENPKYFNITKSRITSYWNCYYRNSFPRKADYVGYKILARIENQLSQTIL